LFLLDGGYPFTNYLFVGIGAGVYWRNSAYNYPSEVADQIDGYQSEVQTANPFVMLFLRTAVY
jgi:hypothetical protein